MFNNITFQQLLSFHSPTKTDYLVVTYNTFIHFRTDTRTRRNTKIIIRIDVFVVASGSSEPMGSIGSEFKPTMFAKFCARYHHHCVYLYIARSLIASRAMACVYLNCIVYI